MAMIFALGILMLLTIFGMSLLAKNVNKWLNDLYVATLKPKARPVGGPWFEEVE